MKRLRCCAWLLVCLVLSCAPARQALRPAGRPAAAFDHVPIGIGEDYPQEARNIEGVRRDLEVLKTNGLQVLRISFPWDAIEPEPGRYDWAFWDQLVSLASDRYHLRLVPYVCYTPRWAASSIEDSWRQPPRDNAAFADFMKRIVTRYRDRIHSWEIWNEPDNQEYWLGTVEQFAGLLAAGSRAVREADRSAKIVMGGLAWNLIFLEAMLTNAPAMREVDIVNLHNYFETWSGEPLERLPDYVGTARDLLRAHGRHAPIWMAEVGYSDFRRGAWVSAPSRAFYAEEHTPEHQAASLFRVLSLLLASGKVSLITWYRLHDLPPGQEVIGDVNNRFLGVLDEKGRPKPALRALTWFHSLFAEGFRSLDRQVRVARTLHSAAQVHAFERPDGSIVVTAWLQTVVPGERGDPGPGEAVDTRQETVDLFFPFKTQRTALLYDELGRPCGQVSVRCRHGGSRITRLPLGDGRVAVIVLRR